MPAVVTPAGRMLTTVAAAREELGIPDGAEATALERRIRAASAAIAGHTGRTFGRQVLREVFGWPTEDGLRLAGDVVSPTPTPVTVTSVDVDGTALGAGDWTWDATTRRLFRVLPTGGRIGWYGRATTVTYAAGWVLPGDAGYAAAADADRLPADVEQACLTYVSALRAAGPRDPMLRSESTEGVGSTSWIASAEMGALPPQVIGMLAPYTSYSVG